MLEDEEPPFLGGFRPVFGGGLAVSFRECLLDVHGVDEKKLVSDE